MNYYGSSQHSQDLEGLECRRKEIKMELECNELTKWEREDLMSELTLIEERLIELF